MFKFLFDLKNDFQWKNLGITEVSNTLRTNLLVDILQQLKYVYGYSTEIHL